MSTLPAPPYRKANGNPLKYKPKMDPAPPNWAQLSDGHRIGDPTGVKPGPVARTVPRKVRAGRGPPLGGSSAEVAQLTAGMPVRGELLALLWG